MVSSCLVRVRLVLVRLGLIRVGYFIFGIINNHLVSFVSVGHTHWNHPILCLNSTCPLKSVGHTVVICSVFGTFHIWVSCSKDGYSFSKKMGMLVPQMGTESDFTTSKSFAN